MSDSKANHSNRPNRNMDDYDEDSTTASSRKELLLYSPVESENHNVSSEDTGRESIRQSSGGDILRSGSDLAMSFHRYGSMQSIPEHEPHDHQAESQTDNVISRHFLESMPSESNFSDGNMSRNQNYRNTIDGTEDQTIRSQGTFADAISVSSQVNADFLRAVEKGDTSFVRKALENTSLNPDKTTKLQSRTPLHFAAGYGQYSVTEELLYAGADPTLKSNNDRTAMHEATQGGHDRVLQLLLDYTRDVDSQDVDGRSPCHLAAYHGEVKCMDILVDKGAQLVIKDKGGRQPAHMACMRNHRNILEYLYDKGVDLSCRDNMGKLPVHYAAQYGSLECLICLVERECDITLADDAENQPIHFAALNDHLDCLRFLIKQGTSMEVTQCEKRTAAHVAAVNGSYRILHWLCEKGCNVDAVDKYLNLPIHLAGEAGKAKCFNCLLQHDSDLISVNNRNETPLDSAKKMGHKLVIEKAINNELPCPVCRQQFEYEEWEDQIAPPPVVRTVSRIASTAFTSPLPKHDKTPIEISAEKRKKKILKKKKRDSQSGSYTERALASSSATKSIFSFQKEIEISKKKLPKRDIAAKYFGDYLPSSDIFKFKV